MKRGAYSDTTPWAQSLTACQSLGVLAEGIVGSPTHYADYVRGILQACLQAPAISKLVLQKPLKALMCLLEEAGPRVNADKTGCISSTSSKETAKDPQLYDVLRDFGVDATGAPKFLRRSRRGSSKAEGELASFTDSSSSATSATGPASTIHPAMTWGAQANGLAPQINSRSESWLPRLATPALF